MRTIARAPESFEGVLRACMVNWAFLVKPFGLVAEWIHFTFFGIIVPTIKLTV